MVKTGVITVTNITEHLLCDLSSASLLISSSQQSSAVLNRAFKPSTLRRSDCTCIPHHWATLPPQQAQCLPSVLICHKGKMVAGIWVFKTEIIFVLFLLVTQVIYDKCKKQFLNQIKAKIKIIYGPSP